MRLSQLVRRFFVPGLLVSLVGWLKYRCLISPRAEVEITNLLDIGERTQIGSFTKVKASDGRLRIGARGHIGPGCFITSGKAGVRIGDFCMVGAGTKIVGNNYSYTRLDVPTIQQELTSVGIDIGENVWLGTGCVVLDGAMIGAGAIITPNSVVTMPVPENSIARGNPARVIFTRR